MLCFVLFDEISHGGGYILSHASHYRHFTSRLADMAGMHCVALDYDLAPEVRT